MPSRCISSFLVCGGPVVPGSNRRRFFHSFMRTEGEFCVGVPRVAYRERVMLYGGGL
jgi:hypothetical protein